MVSKKRFLICGATGFIGRNVAEHFAQQDDMEVVGVFHDRPSFENPGIEWV